MDKKKYDSVIEANIKLHSQMATHYSSCEPHFRPENIEKVGSTLAGLVKKTKAQKLLDLGCGTGFIINIAKHHVKEITGVDVTQAMLDQVDRSGSAKIELVKGDSGSYAPQEGSYDLVTSYSFLHHLYDIDNTLKTAYRALKPGGIYYVDLDPNFYFWEEISKLKEGQYDPIVEREAQSVSHRDDEIEKQFKVSKDIFNNAEYGKNILGGFKEEDLQTRLKKAGFSKVEIFYNWYIGQGFLINDEKYEKEERFRYAEVTNEILQKALPLSRNLFKYVGFFATK